MTKADIEFVSLDRTEGTDARARIVYRITEDSEPTNPTILRAQITTISGDPEAIQAPLDEIVAVSHGKPGSALSKALTQLVRHVALRNMAARLHLHGEEATLTLDLPQSEDRSGPLEKQLADYKMVVADYENARKRSARDADVTKKYAAESLARDLLAALDNLDRASEAARTAGVGGPLAEGVAATTSQFLDILRRHGITRISCEPGTTFDTNLHQAVMLQPSTSFASGQVLQVLEQGYMLHDRVLRPATVVVAA